ncbi:MAG: PDZ domain-containing protein [Thermoguttaceae bacterium]
MQFAILSARAGDDLESLEQQALAAAAQRVAPSVVRIETVGGLERVEGVLFGTGPTTGLVVDPQGYIVSSAFNFINKPASILVRLPDGARKPARLLATDHNRQIVLLKIEVDGPLPVPQTAPEAEMRVGQWCVAVGRTFEDQRPNLSVGILSAVGRIWGKAIQTDAAVSPNNYGGPLVDIRGRVLGLLVPLSPQSAEEIAGVEWYDSGIGFAVPLEALGQVLPRLRRGEDLYPGVMGVYLQSKDLYTGDTRLASCRPNSPAAKAGFRAGDRIVEIAGRQVSRAADVKQEIGRRYAGEKIRVVALRGQERIEREVELVPKLEAYRHGFLGILPQRGPAEPAGAGVRWVYPESPAAAAKIEPGDRVVALAGKAVANRDELLRAISVLEPGMEAELEVRRGEQARKLKLTLAELPEGLPPAALPPARRAAKPGPGPRAKPGAVALRVAEFKNEAWAYVPEGYDPAASCGVLVWLQAAQPATQKDLLDQWKPLCDAHDLLLVVPQPAAERAGWQPDDADYLEKLLRQVLSGYAVDPTRVVVYGREAGGALACLTAFHSRELIRAVAALDAGSLLPPPEAEPEHRLAIYWATAKETPQAALLAMTLARFRQMKIPVTQKDLGRTPRDLKPDELAELARWIDMLDRI